MAYPRKPPALKRLQGNPGKRKLTKDIDGAVLAEVPTCPAWLEPEARKFFREMGRQCIGMGLLTQADVPALTALAVTWGQWVTAQRELKATGPVVTTASGGQVLSPWLTVSNRALDKFCDLLSQFGGTPASRTKFALQQEDKPLRTADDLWALIIGRQEMDRRRDEENAREAQNDAAAELRALTGRE